VIEWNVKDSRYELNDTLVYQNLVECIQLGRLVVDDQNDEKVGQARYRYEHQLDYMHSYGSTVD
jgi:hypothetical protein